MQLIVGAKATGYPGWTSTDKRAAGARLDVRRAEDWARYFAPASIDRIVAEHVLEHMTPDEALLALQNIHTYLKPGGTVRIAVPDAFNPDPTYQENARPGGKGQAWARLLWYTDDEPEHRTHFNFQTLSELMQRAGFEPHLLEYHDAGGTFHRNAWSLADGPLSRYYNSPFNLTWYLPFHGFQNTSLIVDGVKSIRGMMRSLTAARSLTPYAPAPQSAAIDDRPAGVDSTGRLIVLGVLAVGALVWHAYKS